MESRVAFVAMVGLLAASTGCITTQEKQSSLRSVDAESAPLALAHKQAPLKPAPPTVLLAYAEMQARTADALTDRPEKQARMRDEARQAYQELLRTEPNCVEAWRGLGRVYTR